MRPVAPELQFLLDGDHTMMVDGDVCRIVVSCARASLYFEECWEPQVVGKHRDGSYRTHWRYLPTGEKFSPTKLRALWNDVHVDRETLLQVGLGRTLTEYFRDHAAVNDQAWTR